MKSYDVEMIRNVALIGHGGSGKTSLAEAMLFAGGAANRLGKVDEGNAILDFEPEEKSHSITISTGVASFDYKKHKITLLDTPGYDVFLYDGRGLVTKPYPLPVLRDSIALRPVMGRTLIQKTPLQVGVV